MAVRLASKVLLGRDCSVAWALPVRPAVAPNAMAWLTKGRRFMVVVRPGLRR